MGVKIIFKNCIKKPLKDRKSPLGAYYDTEDI